MEIKRNSFLDSIASWTQTVDKYTIVSVEPVKLSVDTIILRTTLNWPDTDLMDVYLVSIVNDSISFKSDHEMIDFWWSWDDQLSSSEDTDSTAVEEVVEVEGGFGAQVEDEVEY